MGQKFRALRSRRTFRHSKGRQIIRVDVHQTGSKIVTFLTLSPAIILAALTCFLVYYNYRQAELTKRAIKLAEDNFSFTKKSLVIENRPYIWIRKFELLEYSVGKKFRVRVFISNFGNTPALNFTGIISIKAFVGDFPEKPEYYITDTIDNLTKTIVPPKKVMSVDVEIPVSVNSAMKNLIEQLDLKIYVYGKMEYNSYFGIKHTTTFCTLFGPERKNFIYADKHNEDY